MSPKRSTRTQLTRNGAQRREPTVCDILPTSAEQQMVDKMIAKFHARWAERDKACDNFATSYKDWRRFSNAAKKQLEGGRRRHISEKNISAIVEEALIKHQPRLERSVNEFKNLQKCPETDYFTPQAVCVEGDTSDSAGAVSRSTSPENM